MNLLLFSSYLKNASTCKEAEVILHHYLSQFGFRHYAFTYYSKHIKAARKLRYHHASKALSPWHTYYLEQGYADVDRTLEENHIMTLPLFWDVHEQFQNAKNKREKCIRKESIEFGIDKGLSIPIHGPQEDFASLTLHQCHDETCLAQYELNQYEWLSATQVFYHHMKRILNITHAPIAPDRLTDREKLCITLTEKLWRVEQIAKELGISMRTVNFHIQNANKKLGTHNKYQTVYKYFNSSKDT